MKSKGIIEKSLYVNLQVPSVHIVIIAQRDLVSLFANVQSC